MEVVKECRHCYYYYLRRRCELFTVIRPCPWSRVSWERVSLFRYIVSYPAMNIIYLPLPNCSGNFNRNATPRYAFETRFATSSLCKTSNARFNTTSRKFHIQDILATIILLYRSISYRTYCGCTYYPGEIKYCTCESCLTGSAYMRKRIWKSSLPMFPIFI